MPTAPSAPVIAIAIAALLAGCVSPFGAVDEPDALPLAVDVGLSGCVEVGGGRFVSFEHARSLLPPGFEPADAADFLGMPTPSGRAAVLAGHVSCEGSVADGGPVTWSDLIVTIAPPEVPGLDLPPTRFHLYQLAHYTNGRPTFELLDSVGVAVALADVGVEFPAPVAGRASTTVDGDELVRVEAAGALPQPYHLVGRFWHQTDGGLAYFEHERSPTTVRIGVLASCEAREGGVFAEAFGVADCGGPDSIGGVFQEPTDFVSTFHYVPGARAVAADP